MQWIYGSSDSRSVFLQNQRFALHRQNRRFPTAFDVLADLKARMGDMPVAVFAEYSKFAERLDRHGLPGGVMYQVKNVPDIATANRLIEVVREYRS